MSQFPLALRVLNSAGGVLRRVGVRLPRLDPAQLQQRARKEAGLADFGGTDHVEGLELLCAAINEENRLSSLGRIVYAGTIQRVLVNRLLHVRRMATSPPPVLQRDPLVMLGMPRTGSTHLHRLVSQVGAARSPTAWEVRRPHPLLTGPDERRDLCVAELEQMVGLAPVLDAIHYVRSDEPDECLKLHDPSLCSLTFAVMGPVHGYMDWFLEQDMTRPYQAWAEMLRCLAETTPEQHLAVKSPVHSGNMRALMAAMPNARLVQSHRDPAKVLGSVCSLLETFHGITADQVDRKELGRRWLDMLVRYTARNLADSKEMDVHNVYFDEIVGDPVGAVRGICEVHEVPFTDQDAVRIQQFVDQRHVHKHGVHTYELEDYGLSVARVHEAFGAYLEAHPRVLKPLPARN